MVYDAGGFDVSQITDPKVRAVIDETLRCISEGVNTALPNHVPDTLRYALQNNAFIFSGFKTFHAMREVGLSMVDDGGKIKPFDKFKEDVKTLNDNYNVNYLRAEYQHAIGTAQMAVKWDDFAKDGDKYLLQYRTAGDGKVREDHRLLDGTTLPPSDPFWNKYYPPNGWGCRCTAVQVRAEKYPASDPKMAMTRGDNATDGVKQRMFRYNAGKEMSLYPPQHPYYKAPDGVKNGTIGYVQQPFTAKSVEEAEQLFSDKLGVTCSFKGFKKSNLNQIEDIFKCTDCHFQMYPELREKIKFVGTAQGRQQLYEDALFAELKGDKASSVFDDTYRRHAKAVARRVCSAGASTYAYSSPSTKYDLNGLAFNASYQGEKAEIQLKKDVKSKWHPEKCDTVKSVFDHELGHKIDEMLGLDHDRDLLNIYNESVSKGADYIHENLSRYAYEKSFFKRKNYTPQKEFIAEAWAEYLNNDTPRPIASAVGMLIKKKYDERKK